MFKGSTHKHIFLKKKFHKKFKTQFSIIFFSLLIHSNIRMPIPTNKQKYHIWYITHILLVNNP